ncbi:hypothetical protein HanLR1_Chr12g0442221 [Helianthus annuus]|nr:hypothetical protein HanLR1_Chr12g0442221 [Helianthus annuus]
MHFSNFSMKLSCFNASEILPTIFHKQKQCFEDGNTCETADSKFSSLSVITTFGACEPIVVNHVCIAQEYVEILSSESKAHPSSMN